MNREQLLDEFVAGAIRSAIGRPLVSVVYAALEHEIADAADLKGPVAHIGGEIILVFDGLLDPVFITWAENAGWPDPFSLQARHVSVWGAGALRPWPANSLPPWSQHVGRPLVSARLFAIHENPDVLELVFPDGSILVGHGYEHEFGDGDDVIVRAGDQSTMMSSWQLLWAFP